MQIATDNEKFRLLNKFLPKKLTFSVGKRQYCIPDSSKISFVELNEGEFNLILVLVVDRNTHQITTPPESREEVDLRKAYKLIVGETDE